MDSAEVDLREASWVCIRAMLVVMCPWERILPSPDLLESIYEGERKLSGYRLLDFRVGERLQTIVVEQFYTVRAGSIRRRSEVAGAS